MPTTAGKRSAFTRVELLIVLAICAVLSLGLLYRLREVRTQQRLARCASNLKGIGTGVYLFANDGRAEWPMSASPASFESGGRTITYAPGRIGLRRETEIDPDKLLTGEGEAVASTTRGLWRLLHPGEVILTAETFVCPLSNDRPNTDPDPTLFWDFRSYTEVSYGYQVPFGRWARPSSDRHQRMVLAADKGPYGAALEAGAPNPGAPPSLPSPTPAGFWRPWNSPNHGGKGQVVLFADSHAELWPSPTPGPGADNIYTRWSTPLGQPNDRSIGIPPTGTETPASDTDTLIYP